MSLDTVFQNLTPEELRQASAWLQHLRQPEIPRVQETLRALNGQELYFPMPEQRVRFAVIAGGSSIDKEDYNDIDLFLLSQEALRPEKVGKGSFNSHIDEQLRGNLPELAYYLEYGRGTVKDIIYYREALSRGLGVLSDNIIIL